MYTYNKNRSPLKMYFTLPHLKTWLQTWCEGHLLLKRLKNTDLITFIDSDTHKATLQKTVTKHAGVIIVRQLLHSPKQERAFGAMLCFTVKQKTASGWFARSSLLMARSSLHSARDHQPGRRCCLSVEQGVVLKKEVWERTKNSHLY